MESTPTPHNGAHYGDIAKTVLMPGDPLRAKYIADHYLEDVRTFNEVRNMLGFTGTYQGQPVSVMGGGMGMPSIGIYSHELYEFYGVESIIRVGSAGGIDPSIKVRDVVAGMGACTDSNYAAQYNLPGSYAPIASYELLERAVAAGRAQGVMSRSATSCLPTISTSTTPPPPPPGRKWASSPSRWRPPRST